MTIVSGDRRNWDHGSQRLPGAFSFTFDVGVEFGVAFVAR